MEEDSPNPPKIPPDFKAQSIVLIKYLPNSDNSSQA